VNIDINEVLYNQSDSCHANVFLINGKRILIAKSLTKLSKELPDHFIRVNQSYLINKDFILSITRKKHIELSDTINLGFKYPSKNFYPLIGHKSDNCT